MKTKLKKLLERIKSGKYSGKDMTSLPTYGGKAPIDTTAVWSWDKTHVIIGCGTDDMKIVSRCQKCGEAPHNCGH